MKKIKCIIIDDEPLARKGLTEYVTDTGFLELAGECENPLEASSLFKSHKIDLMFLDIQMPKINGIEYLKTLKNPPLTIITTAYQEYALQGYELDVIDYLLKPIPFERFLKSANKAREFLEMSSHDNFQGDEREYFFVKCERIFEKIFFKDIFFIQAMQNYVEIYLHDKKYITHLTLKSVYEVKITSFAP
jgi:two-component system LytT family response regulator